MSYSLYLSDWTDLLRINRYYSYYKFLLNYIPIICLVAELTNYNIFGIFKIGPLTGIRQIFQVSGFLFNQIIPGEGFQ